MSYTGCDYLTRTIKGAMNDPTVDFTEMRIKQLEDQVDRSIKRINVLEKDLNSVHIVTIGFLLVVSFTMYAVGL